MKGSKLEKVDSFIDLDQAWPTEMISRVTLLPRYLFQYLIVEINHDLNTLRHWFSAHKLILSDKIKLMYLNISGKERHFDNLIFHCFGCEKYFVDRESSTSSVVTNLR